MSLCRASTGGQQRTGGSKRSDSLRGQAHPPPQRVDGGEALVGGLRIADIRPAQPTQLDSHLGGPFERADEPAVVFVRAFRAASTPCLTAAGGAPSRRAGGR
jgi:hypothetical protein